MTVISCIAANTTAAAAATTTPKPATLLATHTANKRAVAASFLPTPIAYFLPAYVARTVFCCYCISRCLPHACNASAASCRCTRAHFCQPRRGLLALLVVAICDITLYFVPVFSLLLQLVARSRILTIILRCWLFCALLHIAQLTATAHVNDVIILTMTTITTVTTKRATNPHISCRCAVFVVVVAASSFISTYRSPALMRFHGCVGRWWSPRACPTSVLSAALTGCLFYFVLLKYARYSCRSDHRPSSVVAASPQAHL